MEANTKPGANPHQKKGRADFAMQQVGAVIPLLARRSSDIYPVQSPNKKRLLGREIERSKDIDPDLKLRMATVILGNFDLLYPAVVPGLHGRGKAIVKMGSMLAGNDQDAERTKKT
mmetsp:Transcript_80717/g.216357  ORF Transcript_80717/g.216357 Transcript_80717/m.216357 type:complete len:116 (+) Transcript_80717:115-462(+)